VIFPSFFAFPQVRFCQKSIFCLQAKKESFELFFVAEI